MRLKKAIDVALANFTFALKTMVFRLTAMIVFVLCSVWIIRGIIVPIITSEQFIDIFRTIRQFFINYFSESKNAVAVSEFSENMKIVLENLANFVQTKASSLTLGIIAFTILTLLFAFILGLCNFSVGVAINSHMSSMSHPRFLSNFLSCLGKGAIYQLINMLISIVYYFILSILMYFVFFATIKLFRITFLSFFLLLIIVAISFKETVLELMMPRMIIENRKVFSALVSCKEDFSKKNKFGERFVSYLILNLLSLTVNITVAITTLSVGLIVSVPLTVLTFIALKFIDYYLINSKKYYINFDKIVVPKELRNNDENLLTDVEI